jgi:pimeloyl-ACP methyl ester carboxylesterase
MKKSLDKFWHHTLNRPYKLVKRIDTGSGTNLLAIHGIAMNGKAWNPLVAQLDNKIWRTISYDLLGFGTSPMPLHAEYDVADHAKSLIASLSYRTKRQGVVIVAHSMGCLIASHIATIRPSLVKHMILYEPPLFADSAEYRSHNRRRKLYFAFYAELLKRPNLLFKYSRYIARLGDNRVPRLTSDSWISFERSLKNTIMNQKAYDELKDIKVPTDIIYGKFDFVITRTKVKTMLQANRNITFHLVNEMHDINNRAAKYIVSLLKNV